MWEGDFNTLLCQHKGTQYSAVYYLEGWRPQQPPQQEPSPTPPPPPGWDSLWRWRRLFRCRWGWDSTWNCGGGGGPPTGGAVWPSARPRMAAVPPAHRRPRTPGGGGTAAWSPRLSEEHERGVYLHLKNKYKHIKMLHCYNKQITIYFIFAII